MIKTLRIFIHVLLFGFLVFTNVNNTSALMKKKQGVNDTTPVEIRAAVNPVKPSFLGVERSFKKDLSVSNTTFTVTNTNDSGLGSLRQAIIDANNHPGPETITFNISTSDPGYFPNDVWYIQPLSLLPSLTGGGTTIDGRSQSANWGDTNHLGPEVLLDGGFLPSNGWLLSVESNDNQILYLTITRGGRAGIRISSGASNNTISDSYIGCNFDCGTAFGNGYGIEIFDSASQNMISDNFISGNNLDGILISGNGTSNNQIEDNRIGIDYSGDNALSNGGSGVSIRNGASSNVIGGDGWLRNIISGNLQDGVNISGSGTDFNIVWNNYIGTSWNGFHDAGNTGHGVSINSGASNNGVQNNIISGNNRNGVYIGGSGTTDNYVRLNIIGADYQLSGLIPNGWHGVAVYDGATSNRIGTIAPPWGNVIVSNSWSGVAIINSDQNTVIHNSIGTDQNGTRDLGNGYYGVVVGGSSNTIGPDNRIAYNGIDAIRIDGKDISSLFNEITQNSIYSNGGKGIELLNNGNFELFPPTITQGTCQQVNGFTCAGCIVEIFSDSTDEGQAYEGMVTADPSTGAFSWSGIVNWSNVTATAKDSQGNTSEFSIPHGVGSCNTAPTAVFYVYPNPGLAETDFSFSAASSSDLEDPNSALEFRWDWYDDGFYDTDWSATQTAVYKYVSVGVFTARLQVRDPGWLTDSTTIQIHVLRPLFLPLVIND